MFIDESEEMKSLSESIIKASDSLDPTITNSIYYPRLKQLMFKEIVDFCKEKLELREDLFELQDCIGDYLSEAEIRQYLEELKQKYNMSNDIGIEYHIESTRVDFGVVVFVTIKRNDIYIKKFVFRYRKGATTSLDNISTNGIPYNTQNITNDKNNYYDNIMNSILN